MMSGADVEKIRYLVKTREDIQKMRIRASNRVKKDRDFADQDRENQAETIVTASQFDIEVDLALDFSANEKIIDKLIQRYVEVHPLWQTFLRNVKGCGPQMAAVIISEFDIGKADTVSKMWQYAGLNSAMVFGKKVDGDGNVIVTDDLVRGDRPTKGYVLPYNKFLKCKMVKVLADSFIRSGSPYRKFYDDYKNRLANSEKEYKPGRKWKDEPKSHIDMAARRYMVKMFLQDVYVKWRTIEGLPVRALHGGVPREEA